MKQYLEVHPAETLSTSGVDAFVVKDKEVEIIVPVIYGKEHDDTMQYCVGHCAMIRHLILKNCPYQPEIRFTFVSEQDLTLISDIVNKSFC